MSAVSLIGKARDSGFQDKLLLKKILLRLLRALILLSNHKYPSYGDLTSLAAVAREIGVIDDEDFGRIVEINLYINGFIQINPDEVEELFNILIRKAEDMDPYLDRQKELFRY